MSNGRIQINFGSRIAVITRNHMALNLHTVGPYHRGATAPGFLVTLADSGFYLLNVISVHDGGANSGSERIPCIRWLWSFRPDKHADNVIPVADKVETGKNRIDKNN